MERSLSIVEISVDEEKEYLESKSLVKEVDTEYIIDECASSRSRSRSLSPANKFEINSERVIFEEITSPAAIATGQNESKLFSYEISFPPEEANQQNLGKL